MIILSTLPDNDPGVAEQQIDDFALVVSKLKSIGLAHADMPELSRIFVQFLLDLLGGQLKICLVSLASGGDDLQGVVLELIVHVGVLKNVGEFSVIW